MKRMTDGLTIGALASRTAVSRDTLRFYERKRLLPAPRRTASGYRIYTEEDAARVRFIRRAQAMGLTLEDVQDLLRAQRLQTTEQCRRVAARLRARVQAVDEKIKELRAFRGELVRHLKHCEKAGADPECCPVVLDLSRNGSNAGRHR
jgi:DNA-binding transcriptional MerR regulator